ncbi:MAG: hypothetical protein A2915_01970 [Candidatus Yanofskybacteria bacterium RIFCSPLOWO2_01_FULL_41_34]|uniref:Blue (type 1) copper domain-containing protein n=1 Tax=Candidatus Yanofskybacteria bacterium RIFCSPHIGHO2_01_FULL_41_26 TaxID=1802661 RepID=A0A1F8EE07_9BACT|nr:MAG: hypothetical protein A2649_00055 [Candidatus Yanofskybacteria bacterium RIFCSPHIGHO2_01_FULL_41_26]OGN21443.1 MAG: hypothetical protein A2915_01970 [Candidatus Yanofskybacteria bacterium RIFCSPLOWO2_01_FULL_41_34]
MNKIILSFVLVVVVVAGIFYMTKKSGPSHQTPTPTLTPTPTPITVVIKGFAFNQSLITIRKGDTVVWTNKDSVSHTVTGDGGLSSPLLGQNEIYSFTFNTVGTFNYHCPPHPSMTGTITVSP